MFINVVHNLDALYVITSEGRSSRELYLNIHIRMHRDSELCLPVDN